ncbi:MAG: BtpA/SgcQ family protein [bacterium]|nr:BtpA/SgcQ family protein [bacterium]
MTFNGLFPDKPIIGMVHLKALPGAPNFRNNFEDVMEAALADAETLEAGGVDGIMIENFYDVPFFTNRVEPVTIAAMTRIISAIHGRTKLPLGVNVLRNDGIGALSIAEVCECRFIRINILSGAMVTDQRIIEGQAAEVARLRRRLDSGVLIFADCMVKHAAPLGQSDILRAAEDTWLRAGADALIISGSGTGKVTELNQLEKIKQALPGAPVLVGSGVNGDNVTRMLNSSDGVIVGSSIKQGNSVANPVDIKKVKHLVRHKQ